MPQFSVDRGAFTPATNQDNWCLDADGATEMGKIISVTLGGRLTTSTGYRTRWARPSTGGAGIFTALNEAAHNPNWTTPLLRAGTFGTAPTLPADPENLLSLDWNAHGGMAYIALPLAAPWHIINGAQNGQISCRNVAGTDANGSHYGCTWEE